MEKLPLYLVIGFAIASFSPLFISLIALPGNIYIGTVGPNLLPLLAGFLMFLPQLAIWYAYSKKVSSPGGLYEFTRAAVGERIANIQGFFWIISYMLYLPFTITYIVYYLLPQIISLSPLYLSFLEILIPLLIAATMFLHRRLPFFVLLIIGLLQVAVIIVLSSLVLSHGLPARSGSVSIGTWIPSAASISLLFVCGSLLLFLGGEAPNAKKTIGIVLVTAFVFVAAFIAIMAYALLTANPLLANSAFPGISLAKLFANSSFVALFSIVLVLGIIGLIIAEFVSLSRLFNHVFRFSLNRSYLYISVFFIAASLISLINPLTSYFYMVIPSIIALYLSEMIVLLAYPFFTKKQRHFRYYELVLVAIAVILMLYGLLGAILYPSSYAL